MSKKTRNLIFLILHGSIFVLVVFAYFMMAFNGWGYQGPLASAELRSLRYFTALSNLLMGIISFVVFILQIRRYKDEIYKTPKWLRISKLAGVTGVMITFLVILFLEPQVLSSGSGFFVLYERSNSFMHFFVPALATVIYFCFDEKDYFNWVETLSATIPLDTYGLGCLINFLSHRCGTKRSK